MTTRWLIPLAGCVAALTLLHRAHPTEPPSRPEARKAPPDGKQLLVDTLKGTDANRAQAPLRGSRAPGAKGDASAQPKIAHQDRLVPHSLMITDLAVVNDRRASHGGKWSFGYLMRAMANTRATGIVAEEFVRRWLAQWERDQSVNGFVVRKREDIQTVIEGWPKLGNGQLDLDRAPFRLLAVVNRLDLRNNLVLGVPRVGGGGAGEARFVFCLVDPQGLPQNFTLNVEFGIKRRTFEDVRQWAKRWYDLKDLAMGSPEYLQTLEAITEEFAAPAADPEHPPAGSALAQLRTNEIALGALWEMREFRLDVGGSGYLRQVAVKQTPDISFEHGQSLLDFLTRAKDDILGKRHAVPVEFPAGSPFLAGSALMRVNFRWTLPDAAPPDMEEVRRVFALHTCNGCHFAETNTQFVHVVPRRTNEAARLSLFLRTPETGDLALRERDLRALVEVGRPYEEKRLPLQFVH
jgi:hypothetical protein